jgi:hypothetical protein
MSASDLRNVVQSQHYWQEPNFCCPPQQKLRHLQSGVGVDQDFMAPDAFEREPYD